MRSSDSRADQRGCRNARLRMNAATQQSRVGDLRDCRRPRVERLAIVLPQARVDGDPRVAALVRKEQRVSRQTALASVATLPLKEPCRPLGDAAVVGANQLRRTRVPLVSKASSGLRLAGRCRSGDERAEVPTGRTATNYKYKPLDSARLLSDVRTARASPPCPLTRERQRLQRPKHAPMLIIGPVARARACA
jgi:hypothetical protein